MSGAQQSSGNRNSRRLREGFTAVTLTVGIAIMAVGCAVETTVDKRAGSLSTLTATPSPTATTMPTATPSVVPGFTEGDPGEPDLVVRFLDEPSVVIMDATATETTALALLATISIKGKAPKTGYNRTGEFGVAWLDVDGNGCDTRNDILSRDLETKTKQGRCRVLTGALASPYSGNTIDFVRGQGTSSLVQIDHVVSLLNAWQTGAQQITQAQRFSLANDPMNLFAVDGRLNAQKGAGDTATWLPPNKSFRCTYVAHQISVKATYGLWVTQPEHDAMERVLSNCADQTAITSPFAPPPGPAGPVPFMGPTEPVAPAPPAPAPVHSGTVHPGSFCSVVGATGVTKKGTAMACTTTSTDSRLRWRTA